MGGAGGREEDDGSHPEPGTGAGVRSRWSGWASDWPGVAGWTTGGNGEWRGGTGWKTDVTD